MTPSRDELIAEAHIGDEAEKFVKSELGETILGMAEQEIAALHLELETVYPADYLKIDEIQEKIRRHRQFNAWLKELVQKGQAAIAVWRQENADG